MSYIFISKINPEIVNQIESNHERVKYVEPIFDHHDKLKDYVETMKYEDENSRESSVISWVSPILDRVLNKWRSKFSSNSKIIQNARKEKTVLENAKDLNEIEIKKINCDLDDGNDDISNLKNKIVASKGDALTKVVNWKSEKIKVWAFMIVAALIGVGSFFAYLDSSKSQYWNQASYEDRNAIIKGIALDDKGQPKNSKFAGTYKITSKGKFIPTKSKIENNSGNSLSVWDYIVHTEFIGLIYGFAALALMIGGKIIAVMYEKNGYGNLFFNIMSVGTLVVLVSTIFLYTATKATTSSLANTSKQIIVLENSESSSNIFSAGVKPPPSKKLTQKRELKVEQTQELSFYSTLFTMLMLFTEVLVGSIAWMVLADYHHKQVMHKGGEEGQQQIIGEQLEQVEVMFQEKMMVRNQLREEANMASDLISRLEIILSDIESTQAIEEIAHNIKLQELSYAKHYLAKAVHDWTDAKRMTNDGAS